MGTRTSLTLYEGMTGIMENAFINVKGRSHSVTAEIEVPAGGATASSSRRPAASAAGAST